MPTTYANLQAQPTNTGVQSLVTTSPTEIFVLKDLQGFIDINSLPITTDSNSLEVLDSGSFKLGLYERAGSGSWTRLNLTWVYNRRPHYQINLLSLLAEREYVVGPSRELGVALDSGSLGGGDLIRCWGWGYRELPTASLFF